MAQNNRFRNMKMYNLRIDLTVYVYTSSVVWTML